MVLVGRLPTELLEYLLLQDATYDRITASSMLAVRNFARALGSVGSALGRIERREVRPISARSYNSKPLCCTHVRADHNVRVIIRRRYVERKDDPRLVWHLAEAGAEVGWLLCSRVVKSTGMNS